MSATGNGRGAGGFKPHARHSRSQACGDAVSETSRRLEGTATRRLTHLLVVQSHADGAQLQVKLLASVGIQEAGVGSSSHVPHDAIDG